METCQVCQRTCRPLRCTRCRKAHYCSVECQKQDWRSGHRERCRADPPSPRMADWALQQLVAMAGEMTPEEAKAHGDRASDEVKRRPKEAKMDGGFQPKQRIKKKDRMIPQSVERKSTIDAPESIPLMRYFSMVAEEMRYISRYQVTLRKISPKPDLDLTNIEMSFSKVKDSSSLVELRIRGVGTIFSVIFPRCLEDGRIQLEDTETLLLSLTYREDPGDLGLRNTLTAVDKINMIQCSSCKQPILQGKPIHKTAELPLGHWDEIADYLICYSGQPVIDFTTSAMSAEPSVALQDANVLCVNHRDAEDTVTVLPVAGYGEEDMKEDKKMVDDLMDAGATVRGDRPWREVTGGATVACSQCHAPLGFASLESPETFRLLKHRLCIPDPSGGGGSCRMSLCASFLAREMVRYAEAKAIFTFLVALQTPKMGFASSSFTKCILLRLVSWDCSIATNLDERSKRPKFGRFAKIVFEETYDKRETKVGSWMWGGVDLCCPPMDDMDKDVVAASEEKPDDMERKISTVRILLQKDEYGQTLQSLRDGQQFFTRAVANATILAKMGTMPKSKGCTGGLGLAAIDLSS